MRKLIFLVLIFSFRTGFSQVFGGNPPSTKWMQINTDSLRVIFPKGMEKQAELVTNTILYENRHDRESIGNKELKLNLVLQNSTVTSNGFVTLSPFHSVFQTLPPTDNFSLGATRWVQLLSMHEYRHALQNMNFRSGIGKTFYYIFGENGQSLITNLLIPDWFWEGDAVFMETSLSDQGRGRLPSFLEPFKSLYLAHKQYSFAKIRNGSYRDMVPNHYPLGYMMTAFGRDSMGLYFWEMATQEALLNHKLIKVINEKYKTRPFHPFRYGLYPLSSALKYNTGSNINGFYHRTLHYFSDQWKKEIEIQKITPVINIIKNDNRSVTNYRYPHVLPDGSILAVNEGFSQLPRLIRIDSNKRIQTVTRLGNVQDDYYSYAHDHAVWSEVRPNARWGWSEYSVIRLYNLETQHIKTLSHHSRYFSPSLSANATKIVVVHVSKNNISTLYILNTQTGKVTDTLPNSNNFFYTYPVFSSDDSYIISAVRDMQGRMALIRQSIQTGTVQILTPFIHRSFGPPDPERNYIFFPAAFSDNVQLFALRKKDNRLFQIAERPLGNYSIEEDTLHHRLIFDEYSASGFKIDSMTINPDEWTEVDTAKLQKIRNPYVPEALQAEGGDILHRIPDVSYPVSKYHTVKHLFYVHSWSFLPTYPNVGIYLQSQNILNTLQWNAGGGYNFNENSPFISTNLAYGGWFPILQIGYNTYFNRNSYVSHDKFIQWNESNLSAGFTIPLNLSSNLYSRSLSFGAFFNSDMLRFQPSPYIKKTSANVNYLNGSINISNGRITTVQQIFPKFGQIISLNYQHTVGNMYAEQFTGGINLFFPGLFKNHSIYFTGSYSEKDTKKEYTFTDNFLYAHGYHAVPYQNIFLAGVNYQLPIAYPDWGTTWAYLLRIRLGAFFDYSRANMLPDILPVSAVYRSAGASLFFDFKLFTDQFQIPIGIRYSLLLDHDFIEPNKKGTFEIVIPVSLF